jgi:hypothetical protein
MDAFKEELVNKLEMNIDEIEEEFKLTFFELMLGLKNIEENKDFEKSILKLDFKELYIWNEDEEDLDVVADNFNITDKCLDNGDSFMCMCGQKHLTNLYIFSHIDLDDNETLIIGSSCISQIKILQKLYKKNIEIRNKIEALGIVIDIATARSNAIKRENKKIECARCFDKCITKNYEYKFPFMKIYCRECLIGHKKEYIKCKGKDDIGNRCVNVRKAGQKDWKGAYMSLCYSCSKGNAPNLVRKVWKSRY